ncbi:Hypothetical protein HVR_LOCUS58 [uncultured virus]|nr:Hypothetical protein HVR_LOCUS58 [uncultured virus]
MTSDNNISRFKTVYASKRFYIPENDSSDDENYSSALLMKSPPLNIDDVLKACNSKDRSSPRTEQLMNKEEKETKDCKICFDQKSDFPLLCHNVCRDCLQAHWLSKINVIDAPDHFTCPFFCSSEPSESLVKEILSARDISRYKYFLAQKNTTGQKFLFCPNEECSDPVIEKQDKHRKTTCHNCTTEICNKCELLAHKGKCKAKSRGRIRNWIWRWVHTKPCPQCGTKIEKNGGCPHIKCGKCDLDFCWKCKGLIDEGGPKYRANRDQHNAKTNLNRNCHCVTGSSSLLSEGLIIVGIGLLIVIVVPIVIMGVVLYIPFKIFCPCCWSRRR